MKLQMPDTVQADTSGYKVAKKKGGLVRKCCVYYSEHVTEIPSEKLFSHKRDSPAPRELVTQVISAATLLGCAGDVDRCQVIDPP